MKKMPCVFVREFHADGSFTLTDEVTPGCLWVFQGEGVATRKWDGTACLYKDGKLWARYDAKRGKTPPPGWVPCEPAADPITGHWPGWVPVEEEEPGSLRQPQYKHHREALLRARFWAKEPGGSPLGWAYPLVEGMTYELIGPGVQNNPEGFDRLTLVPHGEGILYELNLRTFADLRAFLEQVNIEGIVFHHPDGRMAKIRRADFGFPWGAKKGRAA